MDPSKKITSPFSDRADKADGLTVMVLGSVGSIRSFKVSRRSLLCVVIFLLLYLPSSIYLINEFFELRHNYKTQSATLEEREAELSEINYALLKSEQDVAFLNDYIQDLPNPVSRDTEIFRPAGENIITPQVETADEKDVAADAEAVSAQTEVVNQVAVMIEDVVIQKEGPLMTVAFKLSNTRPDENTIGGYIHIIAASDGSGPPRLWTYPKETLKEGVPSNFRRGELFYIKRFKQITGKIDLGSDQARPANIKILVYSQSGALIYEKEYEVSNAT